MTIESLKELSKSNLKLKLKQTVLKAAFKFLINKKNKLSKGKEIVYETLECQNYLKSTSKLTQTQMQEIFMIRSRNLPVLCNFPKRNTTLKLRIRLEM